jgi:hypothetical protein
VRERVRRVRERERDSFACVSPAVERGVDQEWQTNCHKFTRRLLTVLCVYFYLIFGFFRTTRPDGMSCYVNRYGMLRLTYGKYFKYCTVL